MSLEPGVPPLTEPEGAEEVEADEGVCPMRREPPTRRTVTRRITTDLMRAFME